LCTDNICGGGVFVLKDEGREEIVVFINDAVLGYPDDISLGTEEERHLAEKKAREDAAKIAKNRKLKVGYHNIRIKLNALPPTWKPTSMTSLQLIQNWFIGNERDNILPLYALDSKMVLHLKLNKNCNSMKCFMGIVQKYAEGKDIWIKYPCGYDIKSVNKIWEVFKPEFTHRFCQTNHRKN